MGSPIRSTLASVLLVFVPFVSNAAKPAAPDFVSEVKHQPQQPHSDQPVKVTVKLKAAISVKGVSLQYQVVDPGKYIALSDPEYGSKWESLSMIESAGSRDDERIYSIELPASLQKHRRLVRYRLRVQQKDGLLLTGPSTEGTQHNFAYFVYDGIPAWKAAVNPKSNDPEMNDHALRAASP